MYTTFMCELYGSIHFVLPLLVPLGYVELFLVCLDPGFKLRTCGFLLPILSVLSELPQRIPLKEVINFRLSATKALFITVSSGIRCRASLPLPSILQPHVLACVPGYELTTNADGVNIRVLRQYCDVTSWRLNIFKKL